MNATAGNQDQVSPAGRRGRRPKGSRKQISVACQRCRRLKQRCDGGRPSCVPCLNAFASCHYETQYPDESRLQAKQREHENLRASQKTARDSIDWLRSQSPNDAVWYLQQLRSSQDPMQDLCSMATTERARHLPPQISTKEVVTGSSKLMRDTLTAELTARYPATFPWIPETEHVPLASVGPDLVTSMQWKSPQSSVLTAPPQKVRISPPPATQDAYASSTLQTCHVRLQDLKIRFWTAVPVSNELAVSLISAYLEVEHPVYGFFDADLFLQNLVRQEVEHCSPLLVNAVLFWSCCTFGPVYPGASSFAQPFLDAARRLLDTERNNKSDLNVAALMVLTIGSICFGKDKLAQDFMLAGIRMGEELCLMGEQRRNAQNLGNLSPEKISMLSHVAWGAFNLSCVIAVHFHDINSGTLPMFPPLLPPPNAKPPLDTMQSSTDSSSIGSTFPFFCTFWCIAHEIAIMFYGAPGPIHQRVPLAFAESKFHRLLNWAAALPPEAARSAKMNHNVAEMHICYHATIMDLFRPFLAEGELLSTFSTNPRRPEAIFMLSLSHLQALTKYYHASFRGLPPSHTISWVHGPLYVAPAIIRYERREGWQADVRSCIEACTGLLQSHAVLEGFLRAILGMAVSAGAFPLVTANEILDSLLAKREGTFEIPEARFVVDQDLSMESRDAAIGDVLARRFDEMLFMEDPFDFEASV